MYWRKFSGFSPIGESAEGILANVWWTFANGESPICEILIGEVPVTHSVATHEISILSHGFLVKTSYA
jgi:hypothetical protein